MWNQYDDEDRQCWLLVGTFSYNRRVLGIEYIGGVVESRRNRCNVGGWLIRTSSRWNGYDPQYFDYACNKCIHDKWSK